MAKVQQDMRLSPPPIITRESRGLLSRPPSPCRPCILCSFENAETSGFEQLCKNYAIEKMRSKFLEDEVVHGGGGIIHAAGRFGTGQGGWENTWMRDAAIQAEENRRLLIAFEGKGRARKPRGWSVSVVT